VLEYDFKLPTEKALNGLEAVTKVQERAKDVAEYPCICGNPRGNANFALIFMDCNMPIMDGFQATARIKEYLDGATSSQTESQYPTVIVALTAYTGEQFKEKCLQYGMQGYLTKPISAEELRTFLREHTSALKPLKQ
jgi:CheY-like chemotaxis protein